MIYLNLLSLIFILSSCGNNKITLKTASKDEVSFSLDTTNMQTSVLRAGEYGIIEVQGDIPSGLILSASGADQSFFGNRKRMNVLPSTTGVLDYTISKNSQSVSGSYTVGPSLVSIDLTTFDPSAQIVQGTVSGLVTPTNYKIVACSHTDVFYCRDIALDSSGNFSDTNYNLGGGLAYTDRVNFSVVLNTFSTPGSTSGVADTSVERSTGYRVPFLIDGTNILNFKNMYLLDSNTNVDKQLENLENRLNKYSQSGAASPARLIRSYLDSDQIYTYDQALAILAFTKASKQTSAKTILNALKNIDDSQGNGGWFYFSYDHTGSGSIYPAAGDRRISGAISWVALSIAAYKQKYPADTDYDSLLKSIVDYLITLRKPVTVNGVSTSPIVFGPTDIAATTWNENDTVSLEHNLDFHAVLREYIQAMPTDTDNSTYLTIQNDSRAFIDSMWDSLLGRFYIGVTTGTNALNTSEIVLDTQSWGVLSVGDLSLDTTQNYKAGIEYNCEQFLETAGFVNNLGAGYIGFFDATTNSGPSHRFVWTEGSAGQLLAQKFIESSQSTSISCDGFSTSQFETSLRSLVYSDGGVPYSSSTSNSDFTTSSSVAGTAWLYFLNENFNPFNPSF